MPGLGADPAMREGSISRGFQLGWSMAREETSAVSDEMRQARTTLEDVARARGADVRQGAPLVGVRCPGLARMLDFPLSRDAMIARGEGSAPSFCSPGAMGEASA